LFCLLKQIFILFISTGLKEKFSLLTMFLAWRFQRMPSECNTLRVFAHFCVFTRQYHWHMGEDSLNQHLYLRTKIAILLLLTLVTLISIFMKDEKNPRKINFPDFLTQNGNMRTRLMRCCGLLISFYKYFDLQIKPPSLYHNC
jgi:hypothetical protein